MKMKKFVLSALVGAFGTLGASAQAGWTSGGGELIRDANNPWFLQNTKTVNYCIEIDEPHMGLSRERARHLIRTAIENWKLEFRTSSRPAQLKYHQIAVGTQEFVEVPCHQNIDLKFQLGVLNGEQIKKIGDPTKFLGVAVRTDYDRVNMRGKGFIYVSPAYGPLKFAGEKVREHVWAIEDGALLYGVLLHELGHVFGLNHSVGYLMGDRFPEIITSQEWPGAEHYLKNLPRPWVFDLPETGFQQKLALAPSTPISVPQEGSRSSLDKWQLMWDFFGVDPDAKGSSIAVSNTKIEVFEGVGNESKLIGKANLRQQPSCSIASGLSGCRPSMSIWFPEEQQVFPGESWGLKSGPYVSKEVVAIGTYETLDGRVKRGVSIRTDLDWLTPAIAGEMNGKVYLNIFEGY